MKKKFGFLVKVINPPVSKVIPKVRSRYTDTGRYPRVRKKKKKVVKVFNELAVQNIM